MPFNHVGTLRYYTFPSFAPYSMKHAIFTRLGGASVTPWRSLNVGGTVGDDPSNVAQNIQSIYQSLALNPHSSHDVWQVHSSKVQIAHKPRDSHEIQKADILVTNSPHVTLFMRFADCVPIFLYDTKERAIAIAHAGWKGVLENAPGEAVRALSRTYGSDPSNIIAAIGPSICVDCYPIGTEVADLVEGFFHNGKDNHLVKMGDRVHFDLWSACHALLQDEGVQEIEQASICTATNMDDWFSHRGENGKTGRFAALITLNND
jgi:YfiH family protein